MFKVWTIWCVAFIVSLTSIELYAYNSSRMTLTTYVREATTYYPFLPYVVVIMLLVLCVHLWWTW